ncbi:hypothetical protein PCNPT3_03670 [Psychromonas sp. CNPT3]|uniref:SIMPL domain-containing protein n=1 Tax=Psychromonas sp. CNPT3 TaxID=314282 RepID=UPI0002C0E0FA|nr:SIMPL domain-containing protein [Psychromonas sp. CNPT3]AGH80676.1 hypothetical protein PCNPT3_03670 [Psychromonas sp. CNPT3]
MGKQKSNNLELLISAGLLAGGLSLAGYFISQTLYNSRIAINTAEVRGLAERKVEADQAYWSIAYTVSGTDKKEIPALYKKSEQDKDKIITLLLKSGFSAEEILPGVVNYIKDEFRDANGKLVEEKYVLEGIIEVSTDKVRLLAVVRSKLNQLIAQGLDLQNRAPSYYFTKLNSIKPAMLKEATQNARLAANEFAINAGVKVGGIRRAQQGNFVIRDAGQNYGDTQKIEKDIRVVTRVTFFLTD